MRDVFVEDGVRLGLDSGAAAWSFDEDLWGFCAQGPTVAEATDAFRTAHGPVAVVESVLGDEQAFRRDHVPATDREVELTVAVLAEQRPRAIALAEGLPGRLLDRDDASRPLPRWAGWRTIRENLWHIADTESRYYLPALGLDSRERAGDLVAELRASARHVQRVLARLPRGRVVEGQETWTSTKLLRRLAWHERGELDAIEQLLRRWGEPGW